MRGLVSILMTLSILAAMVVGGAKSSAQLPSSSPSTGPVADPSQLHHHYRHNWPRGAVIGSSPEAKAAWDSMTPESRQRLFERIRPFLDQVSANIKANINKLDDSGDYDESWPLSFSDKHGNRQLNTWRRLKKGESSLLATTLAAHAGPKGPFHLASGINANASRSLGKMLQTPELRHHPKSIQPSPGLPGKDSITPTTLPGEETDVSPGPLPTPTPAFGNGPVQCFDQYIKTSYQGALARQPTSSELSTWDNGMIHAQALGASYLLSEVQSLEYSLFQSSEYASRGRSDYYFVYDVYEAFLQREPDSSGWDYWVGQLGSQSRNSVLTAFGTSTEFENLAENLCAAGTYDGDYDGLPDAFEGQLADEFTPQYHISTSQTDHFATFYNSTPETVSSTVSPYSPISYYRVTPLRKDFSSGLGYLRVDYMTLWDHDSSYAFNSACNADMAATFDFIYADLVAVANEVLRTLDAHNLDNERSVALVAAPLVGTAYNTNAAAYSAHEYFLSAHEGTPADHSVLLTTSSPVPAGGLSHIELAITRSKHATYAFDPSDPSYPDGTPLVPWYVIDGAFAAVSYAFYSGQICFAEWVALNAALFNSFYVCIVDHFGDSGGTYALPRTNVGEIGNSLNSCGFIQYDSTKSGGGELYQQLTTAIPW